MIHLLGRSTRHEISKHQKRTTMGICRRQHLCSSLVGSVLLAVDETTDSRFLFPIRASVRLDRFDRSCVLRVRIAYSHIGRFSSRPSNETMTTRPPQELESHHIESGHFTKKPESHEKTPDSHVQLLPPPLRSAGCSANHALRTAPRVKVAAISSSDPSRPSHLFL